MQGWEAGDHGGMYAGVLTSCGQGKEKQELIGQHPLQVPAPKDLVSFFLGLKTHHPALSRDLRCHPSILPPPLKRHQGTF